MVADGVVSLVKPLEPTLCAADLRKRRWGAIEGSSVFQVSPFGGFPWTIPSPVWLPRR